MDEYANKFLELLRYVRYIRDEKVKVQCFLSGLPQSYKDRIEFYEPRTLEEAIRKAKYCYEQRKGKPNYHKAWKDKKNENFAKERKVSNLLDSGICRSSLLVAMGRPGFTVMYQQHPYPTGPFGNRPRSGLKSHLK